MQKIVFVFVAVLSVCLNSAFGTNCFTKGKDWCSKGKYADVDHNGNCTSCDKEPYTNKDGLWGEDHSNQNGKDWTTTPIDLNYRYCAGIGSSGSGGTWYYICEQPFVSGIRDCREKNIGGSVHYEADPNGGYYKCHEYSTLGSSYFLSCTSKQFYRYRKGTYTYIDLEQYRKQDSDDVYINAMEIGIDECIDCTSLPADEICDDSPRSEFTVLNDFNEPNNRRGVKKCPDGTKANDERTECIADTSNSADSNNAFFSWTNRITNTNWANRVIGNIKFNFNAKSGCDEGQVFVSNQCLSCTANADWIQYAQENRVYCPGGDGTGKTIIQQLKKCPAGSWPNSALTGCVCMYGGAMNNNKCEGINLSADDLKCGSSGCGNKPVVKQCWTKSDSALYKKCMGFDN